MILMKIKATMELELALPLPDVSLEQAQAQFATETAQREISEGIVDEIAKQAAAAGGSAKLLNCSVSAVEV
ncbi:hypothetical protein [Rhizobium nepotum]|uniref:hypothetical protein n=1 Tax=Rhizobium nepotum TaxID=1035271 RepID=UPI003CE7CBCF